MGAVACALQSAPFQISAPGRAGYPAEPTARHIVVADGQVIPSTAMFDGSPWAAQLRPFQMSVTCVRGPLPITPDSPPPPVAMQLSVAGQETACSSVLSMLGGSCSIHSVPFQSSATG